MSHSARHRPWTEDEFFRWLERQEARHELVDGEPRAMTGGSQRHNLISRNVHDALRDRLRGKPGQPFPFNTAVRIPGGNVRYPDLVVDCGPVRPDDFAATEPTLVVEVLSPSTRVFDLTRKLDEYLTVPSLRHILVLDPEAPRARLHTRYGGDWRWQLIQGEAAEVALTALGVALPLGECYGILPPG